MNKPIRSETGECVYCGNIGPTTADHIPPKGLFASPRPSNLITVPSCHKCNQGMSMDDEYFRLTLAPREEVYHHPDARGVLPAIWRSLKRGESKGLLVKFVRSLRRFDILSPGGIYLGSKIRGEAERIRLKSVVVRITKGLFYHEGKSRLPDAYDVIVLFEDVIQESSEEDKIMIGNVVNPAMLASAKEVGNVLTYKHHFFDDDPNASVWVLQFYRSVIFVCMTVLKET